MAATTITQQAKGALEARLRRATWRLKNPKRVLDYRLAPSAAPMTDMVQELQREGIVIRPAQRLFSDDPTVFSATAAEAARLWERAKGSPDAAVSHVTLFERKEYKVGLLPTSLPLHDPFVRLALAPNLLGLAERYLGMRPLLRAIDLWWDRPTSAPAKETQLWHRDGDDVMNVKAFVYFNGVDLETGPFCFIPGTHPRGPLARLSPAHDAQGRSTDEQMEPAASRSRWRICTAPAGTMIICDTCGYHKGLKPTKHERLMLMVQYTSGRPVYPRVLTISGIRSLAGLTPAQRAALGDVG